MTALHRQMNVDTQSGAYQLFTRLRTAKTIEVGALGSFRFEPGVYIYTGRASRNLGARIGRHLLKEKKLRWHIDYLMRWVRVDLIHVYADRANDECIINRATAEALDGVFPVRGFGSSDCTCPSHLVRLDRNIGSAGLLSVTGLDAQTIRF